MRAALAGIGVVLAAAVAGAAFAPVYTASTLLWPMAAVLLPVLVADQLALALPRLAGVRALLGVGVALPALIVALDGSFIEAARALPAAATSGWLRTLESTWPVRPEPDLVGFAGLLVLAAAVLGVEFLRRVAAPWALPPSVAVLGLSQAYHAAGGWEAIGLAVGYATAAAAVLGLATRPLGAGPAGRGTKGRALTRTVSGGRTRRWVPAMLTVPTVLALVVAAYASVTLDPLQRPAYSLQERYPPVTLPAAVTNPLHEIADRLRHPNDVVFVNRTTAPVDRWPVTVLDVFDGVNWTTSAQFRPMGGELEPGQTPVSQGEATVDVHQQSGPWLPTQFRPRQVAGVEVLVDPATGALVTRSAVAPPVAYRLRWAAPNVTALADAQVDTTVGTLSLGQVPPAVVDSARQAVGGQPPSFRAALMLEKWLRDNYRTADGDALPTGHGYAQLQYFLDTSKRGTSEQFATSYVVLARSVGIPARLVVGFRQPPATPVGDHIVRNADVLAWPEVAVAGIGWIPLDPTAGTTKASATDTGLAAATEKARKDLPTNGDAIGSGEEPPAPAAEPPPPPPVAGSTGWYWEAGVPLAVLVIVWVAGIPLFKRFRGYRRRRRPPDAAVIGAWREVRDRLRDHGIATRLGMTVRDLRPVTQPVLGASAHGGLDQLARAVDHTLWSGQRVDLTVAAQAWSGADVVRDALGRLPWFARLRAYLSPRSLVPPRR